MEIRKAVRKKAKLRLGLVAPSGAGKTYSALQLAFGLGGKVGMIDTEHGSGDLYGSIGDYDIINIAAPYTVQKYRDAISAFERAGYSVVIIDSLSHAWAGDGGLLDKQGKIADSGKGNSYTAWRTITPEHNGLIDAMLKSPCHIIATMRAKTEYVIEKNDRGRDQPRKIGMAPVQREGMDYEFTIVFDIDDKHVASASKDRTSMFDGQFFKIDQQTGRHLRGWLDSGVETPKADAEPTKPTAELMPPEVLADWLSAISAASTVDELRTLKDDGVKSAQTARDETAYRAIRVAANARYEALNGAPNKVKETA